MLIILSARAAGGAAAQTGGAPNLRHGTLAQRPASCRADRGEVYVQTDGTGEGAGLYVCPADNTWRKAGGSDHGELSGLVGDDHPQYLTVTRGDARYYTRAQLDAFFSGKAAAAHTHTLSEVTGAGTAAALNAPASGNAAGGEVVKGSDTRLTDSRSPTAHASTHAPAGSDPVTLAQSQVMNLTSDLAGKQAADSDLTAVAGLAPADGDIIQRTAGAWANRTAAQLKTSLALTASDVGLGNVDNTSDAAKNATAAALTNKTIALGSNAFSGTLVQFDAAVTDADLARRDAAQTFSGVQTFSGNILASADNAMTIGAAAANRPGAYLFGLNVGHTGSIGAGIVRFASGTSGVQFQSGFMQLGSGVGMGWSSGDPNSAAEDVRIKRVKAAVVEVNNAGTGGGTLRFTATTPAQITADRHDYVVTPPSLFVRLTSDAARSVTGLSTSQVDGELHTVVNVGGHNIVLAHESASSAAGNRFKTSTGADVTLGANQAADLIYDGAQARWLVFKRN
ncbi:MAG: hypothetical protein ABW250_22590 [Pyrinomonadaceae bacterium]